MKKILIADTLYMCPGGITTHIVNYIQAIWKDDLELSFTVIATGKSDAGVISELKSCGCEVEFLADRKKDFIRYIFEFNKLLANNKFDILHVHGNSSMMTFELMCGFLHGIPVRIAHCHNTQTDHPTLHKLLLPVFKCLYTKAFACSTQAGEWIFGNGNFEILPNAIDIDKFSFNPTVRHEYRKKLHIEKDVIVFGHIGGFNQQKNHDFLIEVFYELQKNKNVVLLIMGEGQQKRKIQDKVMKLGIQEKVYFLGVCNDVNCWMQAMDILLLPSKWEGFGMVAIEAQAAGLYVFASDVVPKETGLTDRMFFISLNEPAKTWGEIIGSLNKESNNRKINQEEFDNYSIANAKEQLLFAYFEE